VHIKVAHKVLSYAALSLNHPYSLAARHYRAAPPLLLLLLLLLLRTAPSAITSTLLLLLLQDVRARTNMCTCAFTAKHAQICVHTHTHTQANIHP